MAVVVLAAHVGGGAMRHALAVATAPAHAVVGERKTEIVTATPVIAATQQCRI